MWSDSDLNNLIGNTGIFQSGEMLGDYTIVDLIGKGAQAEVYKIKNPHDKPFYVAKIFLDDTTNTRFENERKVFDKLLDVRMEGINNIVRPQPSSAFEDRKILILEYVEGKTLDEHLEKGPIPVHKAINYMCQILDGLAVLHSLKIIHRDIKPSNIRVAQNGNRLVIIDFSISIVDPPPDSTVPYSGTPAYSPPEEKKPSTAWDVYSCGVILHEMLTGRLPLWEKGGLKPTGGDDRLIIPRELAFHPVLASCLCKALAYDQARRYKNASEFKDALTGQKIHITLASHVIRWCRFNPVKFAALIFIVALSGIFMRMMHVSHKQEIGDLISTYEEQIEERNNRIQNLSQKADKHEEYDRRERWHKFENEIGKYSLNLNAQSRLTANFDNWLAVNFEETTQQNKKALRVEAAKLNGKIETMLKHAQVGLDVEITSITAYFNLDTELAAEIKDAKVLAAEIKIGENEETMALQRVENDKDNRLKFTYTKAEPILFPKWKVNDDVVLRLRKTKLFGLRKSDYITGNIIENPQLNELQPAGKNGYPELYKLQPLETKGHIKYQGEEKLMLKIDGRIIPVE